MFDWNENDLQRGKPALMDTPTLIEWIQRQLETVEETEARIHELRAQDIGSRVIISGAITANEVRNLKAEWVESAMTGKPMVLPDDVEVTSVYADNIRYMDLVEARYTNALSSMRRYVDGS